MSNFFFMAKLCAQVVNKPRADSHTKSVFQEFFAAYDKSSVLFLVNVACLVSLNNEKDHS